MRQNSSGSDTTGNGDRRLAFSKRRLEGLPVPQDRRLYYHDLATDGLTLCITPTGAKTFYFRRWCNGRASRIPLGKFPGMTVEQAQRKARTLTGQIAAGADPAVARQATRHEQTFAGLWVFWLSHAKQRKRTWKEDERQYNAFLKPWASRRLSSIKKADVAALHANVGKENGIYAANRLLALVRAMFNKAPDMGFVGSNPTAGIRKFAEEKRDRFLHGGELKAFFTALSQEQNTLLQHFFMLLLFTGARRSNVQAMRWDEIDFGTATWRITGENAKGGISIIVPLTEVALYYLHARKEADGGSEWVFPSHGRQGHIVEPKSAWQRIVKRAGLSDVRPHDLRRSLGSWMAIGGASLPTIGKMLGHTQPTTTAIYARLSVDPVRAAAETATSAMLAAGGLAIGAGGVKLLEHTEN
jgi:integrase